MAHNLNFNEETGKHSFAAVGELAWHKLGQYVQEAMTAEQAIELGGLNYEVDKKTIQVCGGKTVPGFMATVRRDTKDVLGIVSPDYAIIQNHEAFGFFDSIIDRGEAIYQTVGALGKGEKIFITAKLPSDILVHGEEVNNYLLLTSGHDGRSPVQIGFTSIRVVCNNTLTAALENLQNKMTIMHYSGAKAKLDAAAKVMGMTSKYTQELTSIFNKMAEVKITDQELKNYIVNVMKPSKETINKETLEAEFSTRFTNTVDSIMDFAHNHSTQQTEAAKGTVWGAYNSISAYFGHLKEYKTQEQKMRDIYFKGGAKRIESAFEMASTLIK